jgi:polysaccharide biosynthesis transport protein
MIPFDPSRQQQPPERYPYPTAGHVGEGGFGLDQVLSTLRRRWWYPLLGAALVFGLAWYRVPQDIARYRALAVVRLDDTRQSLTAGLTRSVEVARFSEFAASQPHVIRSQAVVGAVVDSLGLRLHVPAEVKGRLSGVEVTGSPAASSLRLDFEQGGFAVQAGAATAYGIYGESVDIGGVRFTLSGRPALDSAWFAVLPREAAIMRVVMGINAAPRERTSIIDIAYTDIDPGAAQQVVNALAESYQAYNMAGVREAARRRRAFVESQWEAAEARHSAAQQRLNQLRTSGDQYGLQERLRQQQSALLSADAERERLNSERRVFQSFLDRVAQVGDAAIYEELRTLVLAPGITPSPLLSQLYTQLTQHQEERTRLLAAGRAPTHPEVERVTRLMASARSAVIDAARSQLSSVDLRIGYLTEQRERGTSTLQTLPQAEAADMVLAQEVTSARELANALRDEYHRSRISEAVDAGQAEIVEYAAGAFPVGSTRRPQKLAIALVLGLMLGCVVSIGLEVTNGSVRWRGEIDQLGAGPALAVIPRIPQQKKRKPGRNGKGAAPSSGMDRASLPAIDFHTAGAEAYRILRTNLTFLHPGQRLGAITVTSAASGEGKSTTAANLAASLARQNLRVLLVDGDLRRPRQHRIFGTPAAPGFSDMLVGAAEPAEAIHATEIEGLFLMPRGKFDERAAEVLGGNTMARFMADLRAEYDAVIIDTPPTLVAADAAAVAAVADGVLVVIRAGKTPREAARLTVQQLNSVGAKVIGFVLNDPDTVAAQYGEYTYSKEYYSVQA